MKEKSKRHTNTNTNTNINTKTNTNTISSFSHDCRGILKNEDGKVVFIDNALPNEKINYVITKKNKKFIEGKAIEILEESKHRITPKCKYYEQCGGCSLQHIDSNLQLDLKSQILQEQLEHFGNVKPITFLEPMQGPSFGYRHKARLSVKYVVKKEKILVGFREKKKHFIVDMDQCEILHPSIGLSILSLKNLIMSLKIYLDIPQIEVAVGDNDRALIFRHMSFIDDEDKNKLIKFGKDNNIHIYLQPKGIDSVHKIWPLDNNDRLSYSIPDFDITFDFHPTDFTQINPAINRKIITKAINLLKLDKEKDIVLDLFCGLGNFSLPLAKCAFEVIGVEGSDLMVDRAYENAEKNNINNAKFYSSNLTADCTNHEWMKQKFNKVVLDPPRTGALDIIHQIGNLNIDTILYISCNPATLARDAGTLVNQYNFVLDKAGVMDMFPQTKHVESMALFKK